MKLRLSPVIVALSSIVLSGVLSGYQTDRWGMPADLHEARRRLASVPWTFGSWHGEEIAVSERALQQAQAAGCLSRRYVNRVDRSAVQVLIVCGRPGPIAVHPPTACFTSAGYEMRSAPEGRFVQVKGDLPIAQLWVTDFEKRRAGMVSAIRTYWSWSHDGRWQIPENPRIAFAGSSPLYKMYVLRTKAEPGASPEDDACTAFLKDFLPELQKAVFTD
jgi:Protein of unknown function (DUF3485)